MRSPIQDISSDAALARVVVDLNHHMNIMATTSRLAWIYRHNGRFGYTAGDFPLRRVADFLRIIVKGAA